MTPPRWPAVSHETRPWVGSDLSALPRSLRSQAHLTRYDAAVTPLIAGRTPTLPTALTTLVTEASVEIARFDAELGHEIVPFSAVLLRSESAASSKIENLTASARAIADAELFGPGRNNAALIVANTEAMKAAVDLSDRLDGPAVLAMHAALMQDSDPAIAGHWRTEQVWIGGGDFSPRGATYVAPHPERVEPAMNDLFEFLRREDISTLVLAAVAHAQFETIHPFADGNGRTGRALIHAILRAKGLTRNVSIPVSAGLLRDTEGYFGTLTAYREGDIAPIIDRMSRAAYSAIGNGRELVADLRLIRESWNQQIKARRDASVWRLADLLVRQPVVDSPLVQRELALSDSNALVALRSLEGAGVLRRYSVDRKSHAWRSAEILAALDRFAERAGHRR